MTVKHPLIATNTTGGIRFGRVSRATIIGPRRLAADGAFAFRFGYASNANDITILGHFSNGGTGNTFEFNEVTDGTWYDSTGVPDIDTAQYARLVIWTFSGAWTTLWLGLYKGKRICGVDWKGQLLVKHTLQHLPGGDRVHRRLQERLGALANMDKERQLENRVVPVLQELDEHSGFEFEGAVVCESGTGWYALTPVVFYVLGADKIHTHDIVEWLTRRHLIEAIEAVGNNLDLLSDRFDVENTILNDRYGQIDTGGGVGEILESCNTKYHLTGSEIVEPSSPYTLFYSYSVLHRIPEKELNGLLERFRKLSAPNAHLMHDVSHFDILTRHDSSRNQYKYLTRSDRLHKVLQTKYSYQNRLRSSEFIELFEDHGFDPVFIKRSINDPKTVVGLDLARRFDGFDKQDVATRKSRIVASRQPTGNEIPKIIEEPAKY